MFASIFFIESTDVLSVIVYNLYNIFFAVYAYVGFTVIKDMLKKQLSPFVATVSIIGALVVLCAINMQFISLAMQIFAVSGVFYTIRTNREASAS